MFLSTSISATMHAVVLTRRVGWPLLAGVMLSAVTLAGAATAAAAEPEGCAAFKWPIERERAALAATPTALESASVLPALPASALRLTLKPAAEAALPLHPERSAAADRFAGFLRITQVAEPGVYVVALSAGGWVDVVQDGRALRPIAFSGATGCDGIRKLVRYQLGSGEAILQISGVADDVIALAVLPVK